jgi:hypothetical protein
MFRPDCGSARRGRRRLPDKRSGPSIGTNRSRRTEVLEGQVVANPTAYPRTGGSAPVRQRLDQSKGTIDPTEHPMSAMEEPRSLSCHKSPISKRGSKRTEIRIVFA